MSGATDNNYCYSVYYEYSVFIINKKTVDSIPCLGVVHDLRPTHINSLKVMSVSPLAD